MAGPAVTGEVAILAKAFVETVRPKLRPGSSAASTLASQSGKDISEGLARWIKPLRRDGSGGEHAVLVNNQLAISGYFFGITHSQLMYEEVTVDTAATPTGGNGPAMRTDCRYF